MTFLPILRPYPAHQKGLELLKKKEMSVNDLLTKPFPHQKHQIDKILLMYPLDSSVQ
jgi:hypothetical protein